ncbi:MAG: hypothetical protein GXO26_03520 [Crenarchaeota archaeon]|nr:hypothetical protein [Thermoproteota archaeon]
MMDSCLKSIIEEVCSKCPLKNIAESVVPVIEDVVFKTYIWYLSSTHDGYVASIYTIYLIFTENIIFDAASLILCISSREPRWFESFTILSSAFMMHMIVKRCFTEAPRPIKNRFEVKFSIYEKVKQNVQSKLMKLVADVGDSSSFDVFIVPISTIFLIMLFYLCSNDVDDPFQHVIDVLRYVLNEDTFKIVSEYGNTTPELTT